MISKAGNTTVTAYIRRILRWQLGLGGVTVGEVTYELCSDEVNVLSWKPYPPDEDEDP